MSRKFEFSEDLRTNMKKQWLSLFVMVAIILAAFTVSSALGPMLFGGTRRGLTPVKEGSNEPWQDVEMIPLEFNLLEYLQDFLNNPDFLDALQDYLENLSPEEQQEFLEQFQDMLNQIGDSLNGGDFDPSMFDNIPPELLGAVLAMPMYNLYVDDSKTWIDKENDLFKITSHDTYKLGDYEWQTSSTLTGEMDYSFDTGPNSERWFKIKMPTTTKSQLTVAIPSLFPRARVQEYSLTTPPAFPVGNNHIVKEQIEQKGIKYNSAFPSNQLNVSVNITYWLLRSTSDKYPMSWYEANSLTTNEYSSSIRNIYTAGPRNAQGNTISWAQYRASNPYFDGVLNAIVADSRYISATTVYEKVNAILDYIADNFVFDPGSSARPGSNEDPLEWFCRYKVSNYPFEFTSLAVAAARALGIAARYTTGYKWNEAIAALFGAPEPDPTEANSIAYQFRIANTWTWPEFFIPTTPSGAGEWAEFDNRMGTGSGGGGGGGNQTNYSMLLKFDGNYEPNLVTGYGRFDTTNIQINYTEYGAPVNNKQITVKDLTYNNRTLFTTTTNAQGIASYTLNMLDLENGPHILMFEANASGGVVNRNATVINVVTNEIDVVFTTLSPSLIDAGANPSRAFTASGYVWDTYVNRAVKNAQINLQLWIGASPYDAGILDPKTTKTNINGNFSISSRLDGSVIQGNHTMRSRFDGIFDLQDELIPLILNNHATQSISDFDTRPISVYDPNYRELHFNINGTSPNTYLEAVRATDYLNFSVRTIQGTSGIAGTVEIIDFTNNRIITTIATSPTTGLGSVTIKMTDNPVNYTAGPHCFYARWVQPNFSNTSASKWVIVRAPTQFTLSEPFAGSYNRGMPSSKFNIVGVVKDLVTGQNLSYYRAQLHLFDTNNITRDSFLAGPGILTPSVGYNSYITENDFYFTEMTEVGPSFNPYKVFGEFTGHWIINNASLINQNWNTDWNDGRFVHPIYYSNTTSPALTVLDPLDRSLYIWVNGTFAPSSYTFANTFKVQPGQTVTITARWRYQSSYPSGQTISITDDTGNLTHSNLVTDSNGYVHFNFTNTGTQAGPHRFTISLVNGTVLSNKTIVFFNNTVKLEASANNQPPQQVTRGGSGTLITISGNLTSLTGLPWTKAEILLKVYDSTNTSRPDWIIGTSTIVLQTADDGRFTFNVRLSTSTTLGNVTFRVEYLGNFVDVGSPSLTYLDSSLARNSSNMNVTVNASASIGVNRSPAPPYSFGINLMVSGLLNLDNGTILSGQTVTIEILDSGFNVVATQNVVTNASSGVNYHHVFVISWDISFIRVIYAGNSTLFYNSATNIISI